MKTWIFGEKLRATRVCVTNFPLRKISVGDIVTYETAVPNQPDKFFGRISSGECVVFLRECFEKAASDAVRISDDPEPRRVIVPAAEEFSFIAERLAQIEADRETARNMASEEFNF